MKHVAKKIGALSLVTLSGLASPWAMAEEAGWYGGASVGQSRAEIDNERITRSLLANGFSAATIYDDDRDMGFKLFGGYEFNRYFALEGGYFDLGNMGFTATTTPAGTLNGNIRLNGLNVDAVGKLPITEKFSALARAGLNYAQAKDSFGGTGAVSLPNPGARVRDLNYKLGVGLQYDFSQSFGMRAEAERYRIDDAVGNKGDIDLISLGVVYRFGRSKEDSNDAPVSTAPVAVAAVAAAPVLVVVPVAARTEQYCSILDIQFEIDQDEIQREEKEKLGVVGTFLKKYPASTALIEGHSDNVGATEHNIALSRSRAETVARYLVDTFQIAHSRVRAVGYGDTRPLVSNDTEEGKRINRRINAVIACATDIEGLAVVPARTTMAMEMEFDENQADVKPQYDGELRKVAKFLKANPRVTATVEGHTGNMQATPELAMEMSQRRAQSVVNYMVDKLGADRSRLTAQGFGQTRRFAYSTSVEGQQENRRVNIIFNYRK
ncbi:MAG: OmpA family protein [Moraxellaceae bacterium]|jgi:OOP family OmpA-OmpF porin|nr:OmpA family protein [Moraxellaceae bacterium]